MLFYLSHVANIPIYIHLNHAYQAMAVDKKVSEGQLRLILLKGALGGCVLTGEFDSEAMKATIQDFCDRQY